MPRPEGGRPLLQPRVPSRLERAARLTCVVALTAVVLAGAVVISQQPWKQHHTPLRPTCPPPAAPPAPAPGPGPGPKPKPPENICARPPGSAGQPMFGEMVQIMPPTSGSEQAVAGWLAAMRTWRTGCQAQLGYVGGAVGPSRLPGMAWTQTSYIQPQVHTYDRLLWDPETRSYTVGRFLRDFRDRYGGIDSVLLWPTYTNMGVDNRNTFDMFRSMPGGLEGVAHLVDQFHAHGVKVLLPYHPWDLSTRRELCGDSGPRTVSALNCTVGAALDDASAVAALLLATGADGLNGDTMGQFDRQFYLRGTQVTERPIALEPEMGSSVEQIAWSTLAWAEGWNYTPLPSTWPQPWPTVSAAKYASGGTYMVHLTERWAQNKAPQAATAWL